MTQWPSEDRYVNWDTRTQAWPHYKHEVRRRLMDTPKKTWDLTIETVEVPTAVLKRFNEWMDLWVAAEAEFPERGLLLIGPPGTGKTTLACVVANFVADEGVPAKFLQASDYHQMSVDVMRLKDDDASDLAHLLRAYSVIEGWPLLVLDDLGRERTTATDYSAHLMEELLRSRYNDGAPTIVTSNLTKDEIGERYGIRMRDLIEELFYTVPLTGPSYRRRKS